MSHTIIGTAGHVDHGKTSLIKALTGIDADRLREEKQRGITIELGFASLELENGEKVGIIDVPGHEKFVGNMLAGTGGIDIALLVVAADESFMPQTQEHLSILTLLGIKKGIIALTKIDIVDEAWAAMVVEEIRERTKGTFFENCVIVPVSSATGEGIATLKQELINAVKSASEKKGGAFRLPVDRVFSMEGFGTVVTGTVIEGQISENDEIEIHPSKIVAKVRAIQVHGEKVQTVYAGQRAAVNLSGIKKSKLSRGDVLTATNSIKSSTLLDIRLDVVKECGHKILNRSRLHLYHGSKELLCRLVLMDKECLQAGESGYAQLRLEEEIAAKRGDRFVVRFYSPLETVGGGVILDPLSGRRRRNNENHIKGFEIKDGVDINAIVERVIFEHSEEFLPFNEMKKVMFTHEDTREILERLKQSGRILEVAQGIYIHEDCLKKFAKKANAVLTEYHKENPLHFGLKSDEFRSKLFPAVSQSITDNIIAALIKGGEFKYEDNRLALSAFKVSLSAQQLKLMDEIKATYYNSGFSFPESELVYEKYPKNKAAVKQVLDMLIKNGELILLNAEYCIHKDNYNKAFELIRGLVADGGEFTLAQFRDAAGTSRKYAVAILEHLDAKKVTQKAGDARKLLKNGYK